jgi:hypothetical protein
MASVPPAWFANYLAYAAALRRTGSDTPLQHAAAGSIAGVVWAFTVSPFELVKVQAQTRGISTAAALRQIVRGGSSVPRTRGVRGSVSLSGVLGLFRGMGAAVPRDIIGVGTYFGTYALLRERLPPDGWASPFLAGGLSGVATWTLATPLDTLKSRFQASDGATYGQCWRAFCAESGGRPSSLLFKSLPVAASRAFVCSSVAWASIEAMRLGRS